MNNNKELAKLAISLIDLTTLTNKENEQDIKNLCRHALTEFGEVAAVCIYPRFIPIAKKTLNDLQAKNVKIATVANFPHGSSNINQAVKETAEAVSLGANEIDVVFPYRAFLNGDQQAGFDLIKHCKQACEKQVLLKVIIESGELKTDKLIYKASEIAISAGADFIKTSTGKVPINSTLNAAHTMLKCIYHNDHNIGFKAAGGIKTLENVEEYLLIAMNVLGSSWLNANHFRFGASDLLDNILTFLKQSQSCTSTNNHY